MYEDMTTSGNLTLPTLGLNSTPEGKSQTATDIFKIRGKNHQGMCLSDNFVRKKYPCSNSLHCHTRKEKAAQVHVRKRTIPNLTGYSEELQVVCSTVINVCQICDKNTNTEAALVTTLK